MAERDIVLRPIGTIHTPFREIGGIPIQPRAAGATGGSVEVFPEFCEGLQDLDGFSHIILIYYLHLSEGFSLLVKPFLNDKKRGLFSTRAPRRPNQIGLSVVELEGIEGCTMRIGGIDLIDGTPLLDIKPFVPEFDAPEASRLGWLEGRMGKIEG